MPDSRELSVTCDFTEQTRHGLAALSMRLATDAEIIRGRALAVATVGPAIATAQTLSRIQAMTRCSSFVFEAPDGGIAGVIAIIPLSAEAEPSLAAGVFDGVDPPEHMIARPGQPVVAIYGWGMAATTWRGRATVMAAAVAMHREIHPHIPLYGRAATPGGERVLLKRIGARPVPGPGGLVVAPAWSPRRKVA